MTSNVPFQFQGWGLGLPSVAIDVGRFGFSEIRLPSSTSGISMVLPKLSGSESW